MKAGNRPYRASGYGHMVPLKPLAPKGIEPANHDVRPEQSQTFVVLKSNAYIPAPSRILGSNGEGASKKTGKIEVVID